MGELLVALLLGYMACCTTWVTMEIAAWVVTRGWRRGHR